MECLFSEHPSILNRHLTNQDSHLSIANAKLFEILTKIISLKVLIAMDDVMGWFEEVLMEIKDMRLHYDISESTVKLNLEKLTITTTRRTTDLQYVSIK